MTYKEILEDLGYTLQDCGSHWRSNAVYRSGKNKTALIIYKDTGVWKDFGADNEAKPFHALIKQTLKTEDPKAIQRYVDYIPKSPDLAKKIQEKIEMEKVYPKSSLEKLLPIRTFYEKKGISEATQKIFECGYAGDGKMYRRIVFPIYDLNNQIHGFSGRTVIEDDKNFYNVPKWKHMGRKTNWVYPHHLAHKNIEESGEVILVESIGDCMALYEAGFKNVLMLAGLDISSKVMSYLNSFNLDKIIVSMNNDKHKETQIYDLDQICINPPLANDFGDMLESNPSNIDIFSKWNERKCKWNLADEKTQEWIKDQIKLIDVLRKNSNCKKLIKILNS
jgi:hypothetical protein